jgi:hypothetical protein
MKPNLNTRVNGPAPKRPKQESEALKQIKAVRAKRIGDQITMRNAFVIGGLAVVAIFVGLEMMKPSAKDAEMVKLASERAAKASGPTRKLPMSIEDTLPKESQQTPESHDFGTPAQPADIQGGEETAGAEATEADRLAKEPVMVLAGPDSQRDAARTRDQDLLKRAIDGKAWDAYRALLGRSVKAGVAGLSQGQGVNRFDPLWSEPVLYQALLRWKTLGCFSESEITPLVTDSYSGGMLIWMLHDNKAMEEFLLTMDPKDDGGKVLKYLTDVWAGAQNPEKFRKYFPLALACAVVFDETMSIPNPVGKVEYGVESVVDPMQRYLWYVDKNEKGKLAAPAHHSSARDLVWVVCAPVTTSELEWSLDKLHYRRKNWGDTYGLIEYLMERAVNGINPYKEYSFAEILKEGGICGDQSYFCVNTARAQGIPAMTIAGETDSGGHAWAGVKIDDDEWTTGVGRIGGASKGMATNPQTRAGITEQEIQLWNDRFHASPVVTLSVWRHLWLADYFMAMDSATDNAATVKLANQLGHSFTETWKALYAVLERQMQLTGTPAIPNNLEEWKAFAKDMRREYKENPRMAELAANAELEFIFPYGTEGDAKRTLLRERRRIERDSGEQKDLIASSLQREAQLIHKRGGPDTKRDISRLYDRALRDYGGSITGFKMMAEDYFGYFKDTDQELARKAARDVELAFKRVVETGTKDWFRANTESGIYKMICGYYRTAGDPERADMLEKRYEVLLRRAKRSAL